MKNLFKRKKRDETTFQDRGITSSNSEVNVILSPTIENVRQVGHFSRENNLIKEFDDTGMETRIENNKLQSKLQSLYEDTDNAYGKIKEEIVAFGTRFGIVYGTKQRIKTELIEEDKKEQAEIQKQIIEGEIEDEKLFADDIRNIKSDRPKKLDIALKNSDTIRL